MRNFHRDEYTPWSFVIPTALAVMIGVLAADLVRLGVAAFMVRSALSGLQQDARKAVTPGHLPARPNAVVSPPQSAPINYGPDAFSPDLPGPSKAIRENLSRACIGGTIAIRKDNGWSQQTSNGRPQRCVATSQ